MSDEFKNMMEEYRMSRSKERKQKDWIRVLKIIWTYTWHQLSMAPGIRNIFHLFNKNLYARETAEEQKRSLLNETQSSLLSLDIHISEFDVPVNSTFCGQTLKSIGMRGSTGANIVSIVRGGININIPSGDHYIFPNDKIVVAGTDEQMDAFKKLMEGSLMEGENNLFSANKIDLGNIILMAGNPLIGKKVKESGIREKTRCIVMGLIRPTEANVMNPNPDVVFMEEDIVVIAGEKKNIEKAHILFANNEDLL